MFLTDAQAQAALGFVRNETAHVETEVNEQIHPDIQYPDLIPVDSTASPTTDTVIYRSSSKFGQAGWINGNSNDIPLAGTERAQHQTEVHTAGIGYAYGWMEVERARANNVPLANDDAMAARRAYLEMVDRVAFLGDEEKGFKGLIAHDGVTAEAVTTADWDSATPDQILAAFNAVLLGNRIETGFASAVAADTVLLPDNTYSMLSSRRLGDTGTTILEFLTRTNVYTTRYNRPLMIRTVRGLETAGAGGVARMVAYRRDPSVLKLHIPMPHRFMPVRWDGALNFTVPGVFRMGGLDIRRVEAVRYGDGL